MKALTAVAVLWLAACSSIGTYTPRMYVVASGDTLYSIAWRHGIDHRDLAHWNGLSDPNRIFVGQRLALSSQGAGPPSSRSPSRPPAPSPAPAAAMPPFSWPTAGTIVARFGERGVLTTGVGITGRAGQDIFAAAPGRVVYAGGGLADYGQLVIIEHNQSWLTAYGHNERLLVGEGDAVAPGQKIGEMGLGPGRLPRLYFEIRRNGTPLDPLRLLPGSS